MTEENGTNGQKQSGEKDKPAGGGGGGAADTSALNQQIVQAVDKTNQVVLGAASQEANGIGYQKVAQAGAFSVQDSTDYLRNIMTMAATTQGVCLQLMIANQVTDPYTTIMQEAQKAVTAAQENFGKVGDASSTTLKAFPGS